MRLFYGVEVKAPWPEKFPEGRLVEEHSRHLTLAFLGDVEIPQESPLVALRMGPVGLFDNCLFLPERHPRVVAWHVEWLEDGGLTKCQQELLDWLERHQYQVDRRELLHHVTMARKPFYPREWRKAFAQLPVMATAFHLYESVGKLTYQPRWSAPLIAPFEELDHTADIAFCIRGNDLAQIHLHAEIALSFAHPPLLAFRRERSATTLDEIIMELNDLVARADQEVGTPFKAVSFHGRVEERETLEWEMIVDV